MRRSLLSVSAALGCLVLMLGAGAATASAEGGAPAPPVSAQLSLTVAQAFTVRRLVVSVPGRAVAVQGVVKPYVPGQSVQVQDLLGQHLFKTDELRIKPSPNGRSGLFTEVVRAPAAGILRVRITHARTAQMVGFLGERGVTVLTPSARFGSRGLFVDLIQQRLAALHIYLPASGVYDQFTGLALDAYHRLLRHGFAQTLDGATVSELLDGIGVFHVRYPHQGAHAEGNLSLQLLALVKGSQVQRIYPISSGKPSTPTILGSFRVYYRVPGYLPDGMYYSSFFTGGYAIHGYDPAPDYPASHGCMRLPIVDAISAYDWLHYGDWVDTYF